MSLIKSSNKLEDTQIRHYTGTHQEKVALAAALTAMKTFIGINEVDVAMLKAVKKFVEDKFAWITPNEIVDAFERNAAGELILNESDRNDRIIEFYNKWDIEKVGLVLYKYKKWKQTQQAKIKPLNQLKSYDPPTDESEYHKALNRFKKSGDLTGSNPAAVYRYLVEQGVEFTEEQQEKATKISKVNLEKRSKLFGDIVPIKKEKSLKYEVARNLVIEHFKTLEE